MKKILPALFVFFALAWPSADSFKFLPGFITQICAEDKDDSRDKGKDEDKDKDKDKEDKDKKDNDPKDPPTVPEPSAALHYGAGALALLAIAYFLKRRKKNI